MQINMQTWVDELKKSAHKTVFPIITYPGLELTGNTISEMVSSGKVQFECIEALTKRYPAMPAVPMSMDLSLEAENFGSKVVFSDNEIPTIAERLIHNFADIPQLKTPKPSSDRIKAYVEAASLAVKANFGKPVFGGVIGPYSLAGRLVDMTEIMTGILMDPDSMHLLLEKCNQFILDYLKMQIDAGVNGVIMAEPAAGLLGAEECDQFSSAYIKKIVDEVQSDDFMIMLHNCGHTESLVESMVGTGAKAFHFGNAVNMEEIVPQVPADRLVFGNLDPANLIKTGTPESIKAAAQELLEKMAEYPYFVLSTGCDIPPGTPLENVDALFEVIA